MTNKNMQRCETPLMVSTVMGLWYITSGVRKNDSVRSGKSQGFLFWLMEYFQDVDFDGSL